MIERFKHHDRLILSTLSPVHVGCGEDYEPTHYVMEDGVFYSFDPVTVLAADPEARKMLLKIVDQEQGILQNVQKFFHDRKDQMMAQSARRLPVGDGVQAFYDRRVGKIMQTATKEPNRLYIERMTHVATDDRPIIPGSSLKGAMRTALLDAVHGGKSLTKPREAEVRGDWKQLSPIPETLNGCLPKAFELDPMRLIQIADAVPIGDKERGEIFFATNFKLSGEAGRGPYQILESLSPLALESFIFDWSFLDLAQIPEKDQSKVPPINRRWDGGKVIQECNRFYLDQFRRESRAAGDLLQSKWVKTLQQSLEEGRLRGLLNSGHAFLLRVGRHSGAESVTLNGARHIKILSGQGKPPTWGPGATTVWLAARNEKQAFDLLPFGWLLVEVDHPERRPLSESVPELAELARLFVDDWSDRLRHSDQKLSKWREEEAHKRWQEEQRQEDMARQEAEKARDAARLATMTPNQREIDKFRVAIDSFTGRLQVGGLLWGKAHALIKGVESGGWSREEILELLRVCEEELPSKLKEDAKKQKTLTDRLRAVIL